MTGHLTNDEISKFIIGESTPEQRRHATECSECKTSLERVTETLVVFRESVHEWAEQNGGTTIPDATALEDTSRVRVRPLHWALASAALILLLVIPIYKRANEQKRATQALDDALLLEQVNASLSRTVPAPMEPLMKLVSESSVEGVGNHQ
jgi:hypothetical protein